MACEAAATLALTAVLLGKQSLEVEAHEKTRAPRMIAVCEDMTEPVNPNATVILKDKNGSEVFRKRIRVSEFEFYSTGSHTHSHGPGGATPAKDALVLTKYPMNASTDRAVTVELIIPSQNFSKTAPLNDEKAIVR